MGDALASEMYEAWRKALRDPFEVPAWGNAPTEVRLAWEAAAVVARSTMRKRLLGVGGDSATDTYVTPHADGTTSIDRVSHHGPCIGRTRGSCECRPITTSDRYFPKANPS
jgi:hypothetical protein